MNQEEADQDVVDEVSEEVDSRGNTPNMFLGKKLSRGEVRPVGGKF